MRKPTIKDVANLCNFSIATVSRVLNGKGNVSPDIATKVMEAAKELNYSPNQLAKGLKEQKSNIIGVIVPDLQDHYFLKIVQLLQRKLQFENIHLIVTESGYDDKYEKELLSQLEAKRVDAILVASTGKNEKYITELVTKGITVLSFHTKLKNIDIEIPQIIEDEETFTYNLTSEMIKKGHNVIGVINGKKNLPNSIERYIGYVKAMYTGGEFLDSAYTYEGEYSIENGRKAVKRFLSLPSRPTAIISLHPYFTIGAIAELRKQKIRIPRDISIATLGDHPSFVMLEDEDILIYNYDIDLAVEEMLFYLI